MFADNESFSASLEKGMNEIKLKLFAGKMDAQSKMTVARKSFPVTATKLFMERDSILRDGGRGKPNYFCSKYSQFNVMTKTAK